MNAGCNVRLEELTAYIRKSGWSKIEHPNQNLLVYTGNQKDDFGSEIKLVLPNGNDFKDSIEKINSVIQVVSALEKIPVPDLVQKIKNRNVDILRQRIFNNTSMTSLPLETAPFVIKSLRNLVYHSACAEESPLPYFDNWKKIGKEYTQKCRFGHTFQGSFGMSIEMPIPPNTNQSLSPELEQIPLERRIMERITRGLQLSVQAVNEGNVEILTKSYTNGFNANLCEVMIQLTKYLEDFNIEYSMLWSPEFPSSNVFDSNTTLKIEPIKFRPYYESAAKYLRASQESIQSTVIGKITNLHAESIDDDLEKKIDDRQITICWEKDKGKNTNIKVSLNPEDYRIACDAHKDSKRISIQGKPEKNGKFLILTSPSGFKILE